jgi:hypothetical protein
MLHCSNSLVISRQRELSWYLSQFHSRTISISEPQSSLSLSVFNSFPLHLHLNLVKPQRYTLLNLFTQRQQPS